MDNCNKKAASIGIIGFVGGAVIGGLVGRYLAHKRLMQESSLQNALQEVKQAQLRRLQAALDSVDDLNAMPPLVSAVLQELIPGVKSGYVLKTAKEVEGHGAPGQYTGFWLVAEGWTPEMGGPLSGPGCASHTCVRTMQFIDSDNSMIGLKGFANWEVAKEKGYDRVITSPLKVGLKGIGVLQMYLNRAATAVDTSVVKSVSEVLASFLFQRDLEVAQQVRGELLEDLLPRKIIDKYTASATVNRTRAVSSPAPSLSSMDAESAAAAALTAPNSSLDRAAAMERERAMSEPFDFESLTEMHKDVTVLFIDVVGYTAMSSKMDTRDLMHLLHEFYSKVDVLSAKHSVYKLDIIGDAWMGATNLLVTDPFHAMRMIRFAEDVLRAASEVVTPSGDPLRIRVGLNTGDVSSGVLGLIRRKHVIMGDTVNLAARMESNGTPNCIHMSEATAHSAGLCSVTSCSFLRERNLDIKGKGWTRTFLIDLTHEGSSVEELARLAAKMSEGYTRLQLPRDSGGAASA